MATIVTRSGNGTSLTNAQIDANFNNLNNDKLETASYTAADVLAKLLTVDGAASGLDADLLDGQSSAYYTDIAARLGYTPLNATTYTAADVLAKLLTVDGPLSNLDADTVDGVQLTGLVQTSRNITTAVNSGLTGGGNLGSDRSLAFDTTWGDARYLLSSAYTANDILTKLLTVDGTGSGLDADLLDGQSSAYYTDIVSRLGYTPVTNARTITAGTGLSGGTQDLSANRTISFDQTWGDGRYSLSGHTHSYVPLSGGTMTGTLNVKNGTVGYVAAVSGDASNPGYMAFHTSEGTRRGYIGWASGTQLLFTAEAGWSWKVQGGWQFDATPNVNSVLVALSNHKYHSFGDNEYFFDNYYQGNYFRLFSRNAAYSTSRFAAVSNVEYWHQTNLVWTAWSAGEAGVKALLDGREETGMDVAHANRKFRFIVNAATGWPLRLLYYLQSTWTGFSYPSMTVTLESSATVGGTYTLRDTAVFNGTNTGNDWGIHARTTSALHTGEAYVRITIDITDWTDSGSYTTVPLRNFEMMSNYLGRSQEPWSWDYNKAVLMENNVGIGSATPAWDSTYKTLSLGTMAAINGNNAGFSFVNNAYWDGTNWKYITTAPVSQHYQYNGEFVWGGAASGTAGTNATIAQRMKLDANARLIVGPGAIDDTTGITVSATAGVGAGISLYETSSGNTGRLRIYQQAGIATYNATYGTGSNYHQFQVGNTTKAVVNSSGFVAYSDSQTNYSNAAIQSYSASGDVHISWHAGGASACSLKHVRSGNGLVLVDTGGSTRANFDAAVVYAQSYHYSYGNVYAQGDVIAYYSDERLKDKLGNITGALDKVCSLDGFRYRLNNIGQLLMNREDDYEVHIGVSAQQVQRVAPEAVALAPFDMDQEHGGSKSGSNYLTVKYERLVPLLIEAIKELNAKVERLQ